MDLRVNFAADYRLKPLRRFRVTALSLDILPSRKRDEAHNGHDCMHEDEHHLRGWRDT